MSETQSEWVLPGRFGPERWRRERGHFAAVAIGSDRIALPTDPLTQDRIGIRGTACVHAGPYPLAFRHCPDCGTVLPAPAAEPDPAPWSPPFGVADGPPAPDMQGEPDPSTHQEIVMPFGTAPAIAAAGTPSMLVACDPTGGWVSGWSETGRAWIERAHVPSCSRLPGWSWAAGADTAGLGVPTDRGAAWIDLRAPRRAPVTLLDGHPALGGVALSRGHAALPVRTGTGVAVALLEHAAPDAGWSVLPVQGGGGVAAIFAAPVASAGGTAWCNAEGTLTLHPGSDGPVAAFVPWHDGAVPVPGVRPVAEQNGTLHQLARLDAHTLVLESLAAPGQVPERRGARGYTPGTGRAVFRENTRLRLPWDMRASADFVIPEGQFLLPLLAFDADRFVLAVCSGRDQLGRFLGDPGAEAGDPDAVHDCTLVYSRGPRMLEPLDCLLRARHAWDVSAWVHDGWLGIRSALDDRLHRWRLRDAR